MSAPTRRGSRLLPLTLALALAAVTALFSTGVASAHAYLRGSDPAEGTTLQTLPAAVTLDFNETINNFEPVVVVTGPDGKNYATGTVSVVGNEVSTAVSAGGPAGSWSMAYRVVSADGHPVSGQVKFTVAAPAPSSPEPSSSAPVPSTRASSSAPAASTRASATASSTRSTTGSSTPGTPVAGSSTPGTSAAGSSIAGSPIAGSSTAPSGSSSGGAGAGSSDPAPSSPVVSGVGSPAAETSSGPDWWIWVAIGVAAVILAIAGFITLRKPRED